LSKAADVSNDDKPAVELRGGKETILVVEDEANVRELACKILSGYGYKVLPAESGAKALDVWRNGKDPIDLLMTDYVLPDQFNGQELAEKLRKISPKLKVIFSSGYSADLIGKEFVSQQGQYFLQKPYDLQELVTTVRTCLDSATKEVATKEAATKEVVKDAPRETTKEAAPRVTPKKTARKASSKST
jgi:two-component system, cell cycle sensor histidine kinase and response regulator CckA